MSELDNARANLEAWLETADARTALERFEAAVRANERSGATRAAVLREGETALRGKAQQLSELAEETMRRDLEDTAQVWHEAATALQQMVRERP